MKKLSKTLPKLLGLAVGAVLFAMPASPLYAETVNCGSEGKDLQKAIDNAPVGSVLFITGVCDVSTLHISQDLSLRGFGSEATLSAPDGSGDIITVRGASVNFSRLTIDASGAGHGISTQGAFVELDTVVVEGSPAAGISLDNNSAAQISESVFRDNDVGVGISGSSSANIVGSTFLSNEVGLRVGHSSHANTALNTFDGNEFGIDVNNNSAIFLVDSTISNSPSVGLLVQRHGLVQGAGDPSEFDNNGIDVECNDRGVLAFFGGPQLPVTGTLSVQTDPIHRACIVTNPVF